jgi:pimeloyl-ACP methyl ester carboxylesterase
MMLGSRVLLVSVGDVRLFVDVDGAKLVPEGMTMRERPTIVLLHGGPGFDHSAYKAAYASLAEVAQVVYYDHRGNGRSEHGPPEAWNLGQWADDLRTLCDVLGIERPIVVGASFGGFVALNYALRHPDHPARLILISTAARIRMDRSLVMFERLGGAEARQVAERFWADPSTENQDEFLRVCLPLYTQRPQPPEILARVIRNPAVIEHFRRSGEATGFDFRDQLGLLQCPVMLLAGELDPIITIEDSKDLAAALPADLTRFRTFPDAGHMLALERPDAVLALIREFVKEEAEALAPAQS